MACAPLQSFDMPPQRAELNHDSEGWHWRINAAGNITVIYSSDDGAVRDAIRILSDALSKFCDAVHDWDGYSPDDHIQDLEKLKIAGRELTRVLLGDREQEFVEKLKGLRHPLIEQLYDQTKSQPLIDLCVLKDGEREFFLGEDYLCLYRLTTRRDSVLVGKIPGAANFSAVGPVGYAEDDALGSACEDPTLPSRPHIEEVFALDRLLQPGQVANVLGPITDALKAADLQILQQWMSSRYRVMHFNSHIKRPKSKNYLPHLQLRSGALVARAEMRPPSGLDLTGTLVFLNACGSLIGNSSFETSLTNFFRAHGAACIICTTGPVDDAFGTEFAHELYRNMKDRGIPAFYALIETRRKLIADTGHPMALLYTYVGRDDFTLASAAAA